MKTIFEKTTRDELISRMLRLDKNNQAKWGKMNIYQMTKHCTIWDEWILGKNNPIYKQEFLGLIFGRLALKSSLNDKPLKKNVPTSSYFIPKDKDGDVDHQKKIWIELISEYENYSNPDFIHDFFGKMTVEQIGILAYKHTDHHLRQFNG